MYRLENTSSKVLESRLGTFSYSSVQAKMM